MTTDTMTSETIYMRHTGTDGKSHVSEHRVWDKARFIAARVQDAANLNAKQDPGKPRKAQAEQILPEQYAKERAK